MKSGVIEFHFQTSCHLREHKKRVMENTALKKKKNCSDLLCEVKKKKSDVLEGPVT